MQYFLGEDQKYHYLIQNLTHDLKKKGKSF